MMIKMDMQHRFNIACKRVLQMGQG
jgi:hypothetical protein